MYYKDLRESALPSPALTASELECNVYIFSLQDVIAANPALRALLNDDSDASTLTAASGAILSALLPKKQHKDVLFLLQSPCMEDENVMQFAGGPSIFFNGDGGDAAGAPLLGWSDWCALCVNLPDVQDLVEEAFNRSGRLHVACVTAESLAIMTWRIDDEFNDLLYAAYSASDIPQYRAPASRSFVDERDDTPRGEENAMTCIGLDGEQSYRMEVRRVIDDCPQVDDIDDDIMQ